ncbi:hypothetical protein MIND_00694900 [Mycena indigotica]|uniref:Uncharacterized protein n=1 Tax=Mycena indigotica TaxID=2126181 RepID=A0A8H6W6P3_9AGAR|nr:uncharacterized protein MIND_00694900 [Mycena indigotica]KAF7301299.1 hypothetical protein MIND_00694900 [Mycena indigotica]
MAPLRLSGPRVIGVLKLAAFILPAVTGSAIDRLKLSANQNNELALALSERQNGGVPDVPPQCATVCNPINLILETGTCPPTTCCSPLFESGYFSCLLCVGKADNATSSDFAQAQSLVDNLVVACSRLGFPLPDLTLPGQNSSRIIPTASIGSSTNSKSQLTVSVLPSTIASTTRSQVTISNIPSSVGLPSAQSPTLPTTTPNAAVKKDVGWLLVLTLFTYFI